MIPRVPKRPGALIRGLLLVGMVVGFESSALGRQAEGFRHHPTVESVTSPELAAGWEIFRNEEDLGGPPLDIEEVKGFLEQAAVMTRPLSEGGGQVGEWFLRREDRTTLAFAVDSPPSPAPVGETVVMRGVQVGQLVAVGRDGIERGWALYAGRFVETHAQTKRSALVWMVGGVVLVMAIVWMMLVVRNRRQGQGRKGRIRSKSPDHDLARTQEEQGLPGDPAAAMAMLAALHDGRSIANQHDVEKDPLP